MGFQWARISSLGLRWECCVIISFIFLKLLGGIIYNMDFRKWLDNSDICYTFNQIMDIKYHSGRVDKCSQFSAY